MLSSVLCAGKGFTADCPCRGQKWGAAGFALSSADRGAVHGTSVSHQSPRRVSKRELCPSSKCSEAGRCRVAAWAILEQGNRPGGWRPTWHFCQGYCTSPLPLAGACCPRTCPANRKAGPRSAPLDPLSLGASKIKIAEKNRNFCLKLLGFAFVAILPVMNVFHGSGF